MSKRMRLVSALTIMLWFLFAFYDASGFASESIVDTSKAMYTYEEMTEDIDQIETKYQNKVSVKSIGKSVMQKDIIAVIIGNPDAEKKILIHGSMHAREYMTTQLIMKQIEYYLQNHSNLTYNGYPYADILDKVAIYYVPMVNPDGVTLSQKGLSWISSSTLKDKLTKLNNNSTDFTRWKANINGVDLNRNYANDWINNASASGPGPLNYKGPSAESEPETKAMALFTTTERFDATVSYHATGSIIYWYCLQKGSHYERDKKLVDKLASLTGYRPVEPVDDPDSGYKDWYIVNFGGPAYTIEIGKYSTPLKISEFPDIWDKNKLTGMFLAFEIMNLTKNVTAPGIFSDVNQGYWAEQEIKYLVDRGIISGYEDGTFRPNNKVTRAQAIVMIVKSLGLPLVDAGSSFKDIDSNHWASRYILTAAKNNIVSGFNDGTFKPDQPITRAQMSVMLSKAFKLSNTTNTSFSDVGKDFWAYEYINKAVASGIAKGYPDGTFRPSNSTTRAQMAVFLARALEASN